MPVIQVMLRSPLFGATGYSENFPVLGSKLLKGVPDVHTIPFERVDRARPPIVGDPNDAVFGWVGIPGHATRPWQSSYLSGLANSSESCSAVETFTPVPDDCTSPPTTWKRLPIPPPASP